ncbi:PH domain-containing protein [Ruicaihuangia caeni]|uniref:PH domain-containing protein n=1 Tax=Ruicaihuangia caeni TaxID=3042517 RepID=UPI00338F0A64
MSHALPTRLDLPEHEWQRVSPRYIVVELIGNVIAAIVLGGGLSLPALFTGETWLWVVPAAIVVVFIIVIALTPRRVRSIGYRLRGDDLLFRRGILFQRFVAVPYGRMQLVDINRGPITRAMGLSELKFVTAAASTNVTIPGLPHTEAERLRDELIALAETRRAGL